MVILENRSLRRLSMTDSMDELHSFDISSLFFSLGNFF
jgi:hypothetical protein